MLPKSIRWRLPISYAGIALLATLALGAVLLITLRNYYALRERDTLFGNAQLIGDVVERMYARDQPQEQINSQINGLSFVSQSRIRLFDPEGQLLTDTGDPAEKQMIAMNYPTDDAGVIYFSGGDSTPGIWAQTDTQQIWLFSALGRLIGTGFTQQRSTIPAEPFPPSSDMFTVAVASSPYGIGLRREMTFINRSDQIVRVPVHNPLNGLLGSVEIANGPAYGTEIIEGVTWALIGAGTAAVILAAAAGWFMSRSMTAPLLLLTDATAQMADGRLSARVAMRRSDEFGMLADSFNEMAQRVEEMVVALRRFVADAAHEIHTPLTAIHADLELAASESSEDRRQTFIERAFTQLQRIEALTDGLLDLSRIEAHAEDARRRRVDLVMLVREISEHFASRAEQAGIAFTIEAPTQPLLVKVNETQLRRAVANLLDNAIKFTSGNGAITVGLRREGDQVELWVNDTGIGICPEDLPHLFSRFHRGRNAAAYPGSGLGLAIIKAIIEGHNGQVSVRSESGGGTCFALRLPA